MGDNFVQIDAGECEKKLRDGNPRLLRSDERVVLAFKGRGGSGRDKHMLTTARVLIRDKKGERDGCAVAFADWSLALLGLD